MGKTGKRLMIRNTARWASAAVIVLAVLLVSRLESPSLATPGTGVKSPADTASQVLDPRQARNRNPATPQLAVLTPIAGAAVEPGKLAFSWTGVPGTLYYDVRIVTDGGDLVWQDRVEDTRLALPTSLSLEPNTDYFFRVDAHLASAKDISSQHVLFSVKERH